MKPVRVLGFGDNIVDRFVDRGVEYPGGNAVNVAVFARELGAEAGYLGVFGDDEHGTFVRTAIADCGVDVAHSRVHPGPNGLTRIETVDGERRFLDWNGGGVTITDPVVLDDDDLRYIHTFDLVHSSAYSAAETELPKLARTSALRSFDFSDEPEHRANAYLDRVAPWVDLALLSCGDTSDAAVADALHRVQSRGPRLVLGTRGEGGASLLADGELYHQPPLSVPGTFVDTMGCGDAFLAGFVVELLRSGWTRDRIPDRISLALDEGARVAARQCTVEGAFGHGRGVAA